MDGEGRSTVVVVFGVVVGCCENGSWGVVVVPDTTACCGVNAATAGCGLFEGAKRSVGGMDDIGVAVAVVC